MAERQQTSRVVQEEVVPAVEETAVVYKERFVSEKVRLHKRVQETEELLDLPVQAETIAVERVPIDRWIEAPVPVRQEGDTTVYPVVEEVLVVAKRLRLVEEVRVTRQRATHRARERVALRREEIVVERDTHEDGRAPDRDPGA